MKRGHVVRLGLAGMLWAAALVGPAQAAGLQQAADGGSDAVDQTMGKYNMPPAFEKLGRGLANSLFGVLEIPISIQQRYTENDTVGSWFTGLGVGVFRALARTGVGVYETATFFLPYPEHFAPILPTLPYFDRQTSRRRLPFE